MNISDLYLEGYADIYNGLCRYYIFYDFDIIVMFLLCELLKSIINDKK